MNDRKKDVYTPDASVLDKPHERKGAKQYWQRRQRPKLSLSIPKTTTQLIEKNMVTRRDREILRGLLHMKLLTRDQIARLFWKEGAAKNSIDTRVRTLFNRHMVNRSQNIMERLAFEGLQPCYVYLLDAVGEELLAREQGIERRDLGIKTRQIGDRLPQFLLHDVCVSECFTQTMVAARSIDGVVAQWIGERDASIWDSAKKEVVRPDGILRLVREGAAQDYYFEMDRGHTPWEEKLEKYFYLLDMLWEPTDSLTLICVVQEKDKERIALKLRSKPHPQIVCLIQSWEAVLAGGFLSGWERVEDGEKVNLVG